MEKIIITGGSGTVGSSFIENNVGKYEIFSYARNEKSQVALKRLFPGVNIVLGAIEDKINFENVVRKINPGIIIHTAALKHVDSAEKQPLEMVKTNILGSKNIVDTSLKLNIPITIGISTDKACEPKNMYGYSKLIMERMFLEANNKKNIFCCTRFGNVSGSSGSVIPFWLNLKWKGDSLPLTDLGMNRLMINRKDSSAIIERCILEAKKKNGGFVLSKKMKSVIMHELAKLISEDINLIGVRPGEGLNEILISNSELPFTKVDKDYIFIYRKINNDLKSRLDKPISSDKSSKMNKKELLEIIEEVKDQLNNSLMY